MFILLYLCQVLLAIAALTTSCLMFGAANALTIWRYVSHLISAYTLLWFLSGISAVYILC